MISTSKEWQGLQKEVLLPEMFIEITYGVTEPWLHDEAVVSATKPEEYSNVEQIISRLNKYSDKYATLDYGCWGLNGDYLYFDGEPYDPGYIYSEYSEPDGVFYEQPEITIDFENRHTVVVPGITITWSDAFGGWATDFKITVSNSGGELASKTVTGNTSVSCHVDIDLIDYSQIKIEILKWSHPYQRARCIDLMLGATVVYTKDDLLGFSHKQSSDLLSATLPENNIVFKLRNDDGRWNPDSPTGMEKYLLEQQELSVRYGMDVNGVTEWIPGGTFWLSEWETPSNGLEVDFTAKSALCFMTSVYTGTRVGTLYEIATAAFEQANIPLRGDGSRRYFVDESLKTITTDLSNDTTEYIISEILQMVAHAGNCVFYQNRDGVVCIEPWKQTYSGYVIDSNISYSHPEYTFNKPLKNVSVGYGSENNTIELPYNSSGEIQTVNNPMIRTEEDAVRVGENTISVLKNRKVVTGKFRSDLRMDALDNVVVVSKYATTVVGITEVDCSTTGGAFSCKYKGRVVSINLEPVKVYSDEFYSSEIW